MSERRSVFVRRFTHRALRHRPGVVRPPGLVTRLPLRPARFVVGLDEPVRWESFESARGAPINPAFYLGRVEEVGPGDEVLATLWERPSGRESAAELSAREHFKGKPPLPGSLLHLWTWVELPGGGDVRQCFQVKVQEPELSDAEREKLRALAMELLLSQQLEEPDEEERNQARAELKQAQAELREAEAALKESKSQEAEDED